MSKKTDETVVRQEWEKERRQWIATGRKDCESISIVHIPTLGTYYLHILYIIQSIMDNDPSVMFLAIFFQDSTLTTSHASHSQ